jgi:hypothetical protein
MSNAKQIFPQHVAGDSAPILYCPKRMRSLALTVSHDQLEDQVQRSSPFVTPSVPHVLHVSQYLI